MLIIGLTGGIATGKSTVSQILKDKGINVIDCEEIAHHIAKKVRCCPTLLSSIFIGPLGELRYCVLL